MGDRRTAVVVAVVAVLAATTTAQEARRNYDGAQLLRVTTPTAELKEKVLNLRDDEGVQEWFVGVEKVDLFIQADKVDEVKGKLDQLAVPYHIVIDNMQKAIDTENPPLSNEDLELVGRKAKRRWCGKCQKGQANYALCCQQSSGHRMTWQYYHRLDDIHGYLDYLAQTYPNIVSVQSIGSSVQGKPLKMIKISSGTPNSKSIWIDGGTHAREWISPASVTYIINQLVENRDNHADTVRGIDFYILPVVNPDGYEYSHTTDRLWRKNRAPNGFCVGTDLNRNWGYKWGGAGSSKVPCKEIFAGSQPFSEPETRAVSNFVLANKANMKGYLTFHSYGQYVLYPWGYDRKVPPDYMDLDRVGKAMGEAMQKLGGHAFTVGPAANTLYSAAGGADDWAKGVAGIKYTYTIELPDTGRYGFILPANYIQPVAKEALAAVKVLAQAAQNTP